MWHLTTTNDLHHQRLFDRLKLSTHHYLVVIALFDDELQAVLLPPRCTNNVSVVSVTATSCSSFIRSYGLYNNYYTVIHNYGNTYEKWNIFVAWPHLWLKLSMVKPEIMLCKMCRIYPRYVTLPCNIR